MPTNRTVVEGALTLVERGWCQHHYAELQDGEPCLANNPDAVRFDMDGALYRSAQDLGAPHLYEVVRKLVQNEISATLPYWNHESHRTLNQVCESLRRAAFLGGARAAKGAG